MTSKETAGKIADMVMGLPYSKTSSILASVIRSFMQVSVPDDDKDRIANKLIRAALRTY